MPRFLVAAIALLGFMVSLLAMAKPAQASTGINKQINFQGKVVNSDGTNVTDGSYNFVFKIYTASTCPGSGAVWTESKSITVTNGVFQTSLGDTTSLPGSVDFNTDNIYLGINFNSDGEMCPLVHLTAAPYAFNSDTLDGLDSTSFVTSVTAGNGLTGGGSGGALTLDIGAGNGISVAANSVSVNNGTGLNFSGSQLQIDQTAGLTWTGTETFTPSGTNNVVINGDNNSNLQVASTFTGTGPTENVLDVQLTHNATAAGTSYVLSVTNNDNGANAGVPSALIYAKNANAAETVPDGVLIEQTGAGTLTNGLEIKQTAGTITNGLTFTGSFGTNLINAGSTFNVTGAGAISAGSITSGFGAIDVGADNISTTGTVFGNTFDRSSAGTLSIGTGGASNATGITLGSSSVTSGITATTGVTTGTGLALTTGTLTTGIGESITSTVGSGAAQSPQGLKLALTDSSSSTGGFSGLQITDNAGTGSDTGAKKVLDLQVGSTASTFGASGDLIFGSVNRAPATGSFNLVRLQSGSSLGDVTTINAFGDQYAGFSQLDGSTTTNGTGNSSTSMTVTSSANFNIGNYIKLDDTGGVNCATGIVICYSKVTNIVGNVLTLATALSWSTAKNVTEWHVPEVGGTDLAQTLTNRYGRGYFISGTVAGNASTFYSDGAIYTAAADSEDSGGLTFSTGATTTSGNSGNISFDVGSAAGTAGSISIGATNASALTIGRAGVTTTIAGTLASSGSIQSNDYDRASAGALTFGNTNATSTSFCNSAACDTIDIGTNTDADTITIGDASSLDTVAIKSTGWSITGAGALTVASCTGCGSGSLQTAYNTGATITTASSTDIAFTLTSGNFTASGAGSVSLTPTGASSFTSGAGLTLTGAASSTWSTTGTGSNLIIRSGATTANTALTIDTNAVAGGSGGITIKSGNASSGNSGAVNIDAGTASGTVGTVALGDTNATTVSIGSSAATAINLGAGGALTRTVAIGTGTGADTINIGTGGTGADAITIGNTASSTALTFNSGTGAQTHQSSVASGTTTSSGFVFQDTALTTGTGLYANFTSTPTTAASTSNGLSLNLTEAAGSNATTYTGLDIAFNDAATVAGNTENVVKIAIPVTAGTPTDNTVAGLLLLQNNDTSGGNQITATDGLHIDGANITNGLTFAGTFASKQINGVSWSVDASGNLTAANLTVQGTSLTATSATTVTLGSSGTDTINIGNGGADTITIGNGAAASTITIGNASATGVSITDDNWSVNTSGNASFAALTASGNSTIGTGSSTTNTFGAGASSVNTIGSTSTPGALTLHGATTLDNTFTISGANLASLGGALTVTGVTTLNNNLVVNNAGAHTITLGSSDNLDTFTIASTGLRVDSSGNLTNTGNITGAGAVTLASTTNGLTLDSGNNTLTIAASDTTISATGVTTLTLGANSTINPTSSGTLGIGTSNITTLTLGNNSGSTALQLTSGTGSQTHTSSNATGSTTSSSFVYTDASLGTTGGLVYFNPTSTTLTTGYLLKNNSVTYNHTAGETGSLIDWSFTDGTTNAFTTTTNGILLSPTINAGSGAATRTINGLSVNPAFTSCAAGSCAVNGINIANVTDGTGFTGTALKIGTGWDFGIDAGNQLIVNVGNAGTDFDTSGGLTLAGTLTVNGTSLTATSATTVTLGSSGTDTINIGNGGADTITIGNGAAASTITIGNASATGVSITDDNWSVNTSGNASFAALTASGNSTIGTGSSTTNTFGAGASSVNTIGSTSTPGALTLHGATTLDNTFTISGANLASLGGALTVTGVTTLNNNLVVNNAGAHTITLGSSDNLDTFTIASTGLRVDSSGNLTNTGNITGAGAVTLSSGGANQLALDTGGAAAIKIGSSSNATSVSICNSANCDTIDIGNLATTDADTITIGDVLDSVAINSTGWNITAGGALTVVSCSGCGGGSVSFSAITTGTNATALHVGTGGSLDATGSGTITATAVPASGLTGTTLASGVTASSLTSLGTLTSLTVSGATTLNNNLLVNNAGAHTITLGSSDNLDTFTIASTGLRVDSSGNLTNTGNITGAGALTLSSGGTNTLALDTGGGAALNIGGNNANAITIGRTGNTSAITLNSGVTTGSLTNSAFVLSDTALTSGTGFQFTPSNPQVNANTSGALSTGKLINIASANHTYLKFDNLDLTVGGHTNQFSTVNGFSSTIGNENNTFVYDTARDRDGGRWTSDERAVNSSWYTENGSSASGSPVTSAACVIGTNARCGQAAFPDKAILVATNDHLYIFDAKDNSLWMDFQQGTNFALGAAASNEISSVFGLNGVLYVATNGTGTGGYAINFKSDKITRYNTTDATDFSLPIASRNSGGSYTSQGRTALKLASNTVNDVYAQVVNGKTYVIFAQGQTAGSVGVSMINESSQTAIHFGSNNLAFTAVALTADNNLYALNSTNSELDVWYNATSAAGTISAGTATSTFYDETTKPALSNGSSAPTINTNAPDALYVTNGTSDADGQSNTIYVGHNNGLSGIEEKVGDETGGAVKLYTNNMISEEMYGDVRASLPLAGSGPLTASTTITKGTDGDVSVKQTDFTTNACSANCPTHSSGVRGNAMTFNGTTNAAFICSGITAACANSANFNTGTSNFSLGFWIKTASSPTSKVIFDNRSNAGATAAGVLGQIDASGKMKVTLNDNITQTASVTSNRVVNDNLWHYVAFTINRPTNPGNCTGTNTCTLSLYVDGLLDTTATTAALNSTSGAGAFYIGCDATTAGPTNCVTATLDEFSFTATALNAGQVRFMYDVGSRALYSGNNGSGTYHSAQTIRGGISIGADGSQKLNGSAVVKAVNPYLGNGLLYVGTAAGVSVIGLDTDSLIDAYSTSATSTKDDVNNTYDATNGNAINSISVQKGYGTGVLLSIGFFASANNGGIWLESNNTGLRDFLGNSYDPFGDTLVQTNLVADRVFRVSNQISTRLDNFALTGVTQPQLFDILRADSNGVAINSPAEALYTNTSGTNTVNGLTINSVNNITTSGAGGTTTYTGLNITNPNITQTAGTVTATGLGIALGTLTTGGAQIGLNFTSSNLTDTHSATAANNNIAGIAFVKSSTGATANNFTIKNISGTTTNNLFELRDLTANTNAFGGLALADAFASRQSYFGEEFDTWNPIDCKNSTAVTADNHYLSRGTHVVASSTVAASLACTTTLVHLLRGEISASSAFSLGSTSNTCTYQSGAAASNTNGFERMLIGTTATPTVSCLEYLGGAAGANTGNMVFNTAFLPQVQMKFRASATSATASNYIGVSNIVTATSHPATTDKGFYFTNCTAPITPTCGSNWVGVISDGTTTPNSGTSTNATACPATDSDGSSPQTTKFMYGRIESRKVIDNTTGTAVEVQFFIDYDVTNGIHETSCGTITSTGASNWAASGGTGLTLFYMTNTIAAASTQTFDLDYFRVWQDDNRPGGGNEAQASSAGDGSSQPPIGDSENASAGGSPPDNNLLTPPPISPDSPDPTVAGSFFNFMGNTTEDTMFDHNLFVKGTLYADKIKANQIEGLQIFTDQISSLQEKLAAESGSSTNTQDNSSNSVDAANLPNSVKFDNVRTASLLAMAQIEAKGGLVVDKDSHFNGKTFFELLAEFNGAANFNGNVSFKNQPSFNSDAGGVAVIKNGAQKVQIKFDSPYSQPPVVIASWATDIANADAQARIFEAGYNYFITKTDENGFWIYLNKPATEDVKLNWIATSVRDAKTAQSEPVTTSQ